jgi:hypothetical protein
MLLPDIKRKIVFFIYFRIGFIVFLFRFTFQRVAFEPKSKKPLSASKSRPSSATVGNSNKDATAVSSSFSGRAGKPLELIQVTMKEDENNFNEKQKIVLSELRKVCRSASDVNQAGKLFTEYDFNGNSKSPLSSSFIYL